MCELKFSLQVVIYFLHLIYMYYNLRGASKQALTELKLLTVISKKQ